jgi:citrate lyase subunit beta/citryl-CoA lyase
MSLGSEDLTGEMGVQTTSMGDELLYARSKVMTDAFAAGVQPMGLVGVDPFTWGDPEKIYEAAVKSRKLGFKGALSIHPGPISSLNRGYSIPSEEVDYMMRALTAFEEGVRRGTASVEVDGRMIDIATAERCRKVMERATAIEKKEKRKSEALRDQDALEERLRLSIEKL